jgi:hypothetical protein
VVWFVFFDAEIGMSQDVGSTDATAAPVDNALVPRNVVANAAQAAAGLFGNSQKKQQVLVDQLLATYVEAKDKDVVVVFNSGGWGWNGSQTSGWSSILDGIKTQLENEGYRTVIINYRRTGSGLRAIFKEFYEAALRYPNKAPELAVRIKFLTDSLPDLKVIIAGESTGTVISDKTMVLLKNEPRVFSIQTGTPFWHKSADNGRSLLINSNGAVPDTFSYGDVPAMVWATVKSWFGLDSPDDEAGNILFWLRAPGHDYSWQYPGVYDGVVNFIKNNFGNKD